VGDRCDPEPGTCFPKAHAAYETVKSFLYGHSIAWLHKEKILNLELTMFHLKWKVSNKRHKFFGKSYFLSPVNINFTCLYFCESKCKM
jgi:hypothetical protein